MHEASQWDESCFITLTYDDDHVPPGETLRYRDYQLFMKKLRKLLAQPVRFYMCGEYGEGTNRPHYHAALFGVSFRHDRVVWRNFGSGHVVYRSGLLEKAWAHGMSSIGELTQESANYIARYVMKKITGQQADEHYKVVDDETGEVSWREPEFTRMSLRPGIGATWFERFGTTDVFPHDRVIWRGRAGKPPRYYDRLYERGDPAGMDEVRAARELRASERREDGTPARLAVREQVQSARLRFFKRKLK